MEMRFAVRRLVLKVQVLVLLLKELVVEALCLTSINKNLTGV